MGDKQVFEFEGSASPSEAADALNRIADGLRARSLSLSLGEEEITIFPAGDLSMEIEAIEKMVKSDAWKEVLKQKGWDDAYLGGDAFTDFLKKEIVRVTDVLKSVGLVKS